MNTTDFNHLFFVLLNNNENSPEETLDFYGNREFWEPATNPETDSRFVVNF